MTGKGFMTKSVSSIKYLVLSIKKKWGWVIGWGFPIIVFYFLLRLPNLTLLPIFADEAIYVRWAQVMKAEPTLRFLPLSDGKQPLFMWILMFSLGIIKDPLFTGRLLSILSGLGSLIGLFALSLALFKDKKIALLSAFIYAVVPFTVFFDRMALVDSMLTMFGIWVLFFGILLAQYLRLDLAMITGMVLGGALITKSPGIFFVALLPTTVLLIKAKKKKFPLQLIKLGWFLLVVYFFAFVIYNILRLGPNFHLIASRNKDYVFTLQEVMAHPLYPFIPHLKEIWQWNGGLLTWPIFLLGIIGMGIGLKKNWRESLLLFSWWAIPLLVQSQMAKVFTPRYILFSVPSLLVFAALGTVTCLSWFQKRLAKNFAWGLGLAALLVMPLSFNSKLLTDPEAAPLPRRMRYGYLEEWTAGQGIKEAAAYLRERAKETNVLVGTEGFFGTLPDGLQIYVEKVPNLTVIGVGLNLEEVPDSLISSMVDNEVYLLINNDRLWLKPEEHNLRLIAEYPKAENPDGKRQKLQLFRLEP